MSKVGIITDTISCLPPNLIKELGIRIVPVGLIIDRKQYKDTELPNDEFWKLFYQTKEHITTTAANPADFVDIYTELAKLTDSIVCIHVSSKLSATYQSAVKAVESVKADNPSLKIEVIDSTTAAGAQGFIVLEAARAAQAGKNLEEVVRIVKDMIPRVKFLMVMGTLKYLIKGGRAPKSAVLGEMMKVKPIIGMVSGTGLVENMGRARGKRKAMEKIAEMTKEYIDISKPVHLMVHYTDDIAAGEELKEIVTSRLNCTEVYLTPYTPVMACHTGPVVSIAFYS
jgi:DegV family protein with EDD domain